MLALTEYQRLGGPVTCLRYVDKQRCR